MLLNTCSVNTCCITCPLGCHRPLRFDCPGRLSAAAARRTDVGNNHPLRGHKHDPWEGGTRSTAFVTGGLVPPALRGTNSGCDMAPETQTQDTFEGCSTARAPRNFFELHQPDVTQNTRLM